MKNQWWIKSPYYYWWRDVTDWIPSGQGVLVDVGCGAGLQRDSIISKGYRWIGIDVEKRTDKFEIKMIKDGIFPVDSDGADLLLCRQVLEHVENLSVFGFECKRIMKPGGIIYGSSSWLEPDHDSASYCNFSHKGISAYWSRFDFDLIRIEAGIHSGVLLLYQLFSSNIASRFARLMAFLQSWADKKIIKNRSSEYPGMNLEQIKNTNALRFAGHLLWAVKKRI